MTLISYIRVNPSRISTQGHDFQGSAQTLNPKTQGHDFQGSQDATLQLFDAAVQPDWQLKNSIWGGLGLRV